MPSSKAYKPYSHSPVGIMLLRRTGRIIMLNPNAECGAIISFANREGEEEEKG